MGEVLEDVDAGEEEEGEDGEVVDVLGLEVVGDRENLVVEGRFGAFELGVEEMGFGEVGLEVLQQKLCGSG